MLSDLNIDNLLFKQYIIVAERDAYKLKEDYNLGIVSYEHLLRLQELLRKEGMKEKFILRKEENEYKRIKSITK